MAGSWVASDVVVSAFKDHKDRRTNLQRSER